MPIRLSLTPMDSSRFSSMWILGLRTISWVRTNIFLPAQKIGASEPITSAHSRLKSLLQFKRILVHIENRWNEQLIDTSKPYPKGENV